MINRILLFIYLCLAHYQAFSQCDNYMNPGNRVLSAATLCAPVDYSWEIEYTVLESGTIEVYVDWDDGTDTEIITTPSGLFRYRAILHHTYPKGGDKCNYEPKAYLKVNGVLCTSSVQTQTVTVWDTDDENGGVIQADPEVYRLCLGQSASLSFEDNSIFNCVPASGENDRINQLNRWVRWEYGVGDPANRIPGVEVDGEDDDDFPYQGAVEYRPTPLENPWSISEAVTVPAITDPAMVGKSYTVRLSNWNHCNPYDSDVTDGDPLNPISAGGDNAPLQTLARVVIVDSPTPDFTTRLGDVSGAEETVFCVGEPIYFQNLSTAGSGASLKYTWSFYDDDTGANIVAQQTRENPTRAFNNPGRKLVILEVEDNNSIGNCGESTFMYVDIVSIGQADIEVQEEELCLPAEGTTTVLVRNHSTINEISLANWTWQVLDSTELLIYTEAGTGIAPDLTTDMTRPGTYRAVLTLREQGKRCHSSDTAMFTVNEPQAVDFTFNQACQGDTLHLESTATDADEYLWDIDNDAAFEYNGQQIAVAGLAPGTHLVRHSVRSGFCYNTITQEIKVYARPDAAIAVTKISESCDQISYQFIGNAVVDHSYKWGFTTEPLYSTSLTRASVEATFQKTGELQSVDALLTVASDLTNCVSEQSRHQLTIPILERPEAKMSLYPNIIYMDNPVVEVENLVNDQGYTYRWDFGDGHITQERHPGDHTYQEPGMYIVRMFVSNELCQAEDSMYVQVNQVAPQVGYDFEYASPCNPNEVVFRNRSNYTDTTTYRWDFGDGTTSYLTNPTHTFREPGTYRVRLSGSNSMGTVYEDQEITIAPDKGPIALFEVETPERFLVDEPVYLKNHSQKYNSLIWDFGDGNYSSDVEPEHTFTQTGTYRIKLTVSDSSGCVDSLVHQIIVEPSLPVAGFELTPTAGCGPLAVSFKNLSQHATSHLWSFGFNQGISQQKEPTYTYFQAGSYTVSLVAFNAAGASDTVSQTLAVEVYAQPTALFKVKSQQVFQGDPVFISNNSLGATNYTWDFGDGQTSYEPEPQHTYQEPGSYDITLIASNADGCRDTLITMAAVIVESGGDVSIPNAFSPVSNVGEGSTSNGDNDIFRPVLEGVVSYHLMIYNRWGELLFESYDKNHGWDGYYKGKLQPRGVYVYRLEVVLSNGAEKKILGDLTLVR